uniref:Trimeric intracellular cation channel type A n=1 Tax=Amphiprion percula TaxID=161767 RepID=A0A3P8S1F6_AMPPE
MFLAGVPWPPGSAPCSTASAVTSWRTSCLEAAPSTISNTTATSCWPQLSGSGVALISNFEQLLRGVWRPDTNEILNMSFPTKASLYGAILFTMQEAHWLPVSKSVLILVFTLFMATTKVFMTARHSHGSPFALIESWTCHLLFGSPLGGGEEDHHHAAAAAPSSPLKTKEELSEGVRKRKAKKAE